MPWPSSVAAYIVTQFGGWILAVAVLVGAALLLRRPRRHDRDRAPRR